MNTVRRSLKINGEIKTVEHREKPSTISNVYVIENGKRASCHVIPLSGKFRTRGDQYEWLGN